MQVVELAIDGNGNVTRKVIEGGMEAALAATPWALREWAAAKCDSELTLAAHVRRRAALRAALDAADLG